MDLFDISSRSLSEMRPWAVFLSGLRHLAWGPDFSTAWPQIRGGPGVGAKLKEPLFIWAHILFAHSSLDRRIGPSRLASWARFFQNAAKNPPFEKPKVAKQPRPVLLKKIKAPAFGVHPNQKSLGCFCSRVNPENVSISFISSCVKQRHI